MHETNTRNKTCAEVTRRIYLQVGDAKYMRGTHLPLLMHAAIRLAPNSGR
jgi:hypothetical protein